MNTRPPPDRVYGTLFEAVQKEHLFGDSKTFVDAIARSEPDEILRAYRSERETEEFDLGEFVATHFDIPTTPEAVAPDPADLPVAERIEQLWDVLTRDADENIANSSLIPLPNRYVVPGGRFREVYYWDSYFTMLGLAGSGRIDLICDMVDNFAWLIDEIGFIPNGNRTYYCSRSQPPYFALMVQLLADVSGDDSLSARYLPQMKREHAFWMAGADTLLPDSPEHRRVLLSPDGLLNRYWDDAATPRQESHAEDIAVARASRRNAEQLYRDIRAGAESGWDYSSRWFADRRSMDTIRTTKIVPVDLNSLLFNLEETIARVSRSEGDTATADRFDAWATNRKEMLQQMFFDDATGVFTDLSLPDFEVTGTLSIATVYPLFFGIATTSQADLVAAKVHAELLKAGGWVTSNHDSGQQWDSPNGWAPMQWITYIGLKRYGYEHEARAGAERWIADNLAVYEEHGRLLEKYNVVDTGLAGTGGEYEVQDGFGWTNAVLLRLMDELRR